MRHLDDVMMERLARKATWETEYNRNALMQRFAGRQDDGSLESDRRLLVRMGLARAENMVGWRMVQEPEAAAEPAGHEENNVEPVIKQEEGGDDNEGGERPRRQPQRKKRKVA
jgi:hypothetical protein